MSAFLAAKCDAGNVHGTCPAVVYSNALTLDRLVPTLLAHRWTIDDLGRTYCERHRDSAILASPPL